MLLNVLEHGFNEENFTAPFEDMREKLDKCFQKFQKTRQQFQNKKKLLIAIRQFTSVRGHFQAATSSKNGEYKPEPIYRKHMTFLALLQLFCSNFKNTAIALWSCRYFVRLVWYTAVSREVIGRKSQAYPTRPNGSLRFHSNWNSAHRWV